MTQRYMLLHAVNRNFYWSTARCTIIDSGSNELRTFELSDCEGQFKHCNNNRLGIVNRRMGSLATEDDKHEMNTWQVIRSQNFAATYDICDGSRFAVNVVLDEKKCRRELSLKKVTESEDFLLFSTRMMSTEKASNDKSNKGELSRPSPDKLNNVKEVMIAQV